MPTFQVVVLSFLLKGWYPTRLSVCCSTRNASDGLVGIVFFRAVIELNSEDRNKATWQSYVYLQTTMNDLYL
jgi:hypothetical protein